MILIVDDQPDNTALLLKVLSLRRLPAVAVGSGEAALAWVGRHGPPSLVVMDEMMPGLSGRETVRLMREVRGMDRTPVVFFTASLLDPAEVADLGAVGLFRKGSADLDEMLRVLENAHRFGVQDPPPPARGGPG